MAKKTKTPETPAAPESTPVTNTPQPDPKEQLIQDYTNTLKRLQADFENYVKRAETEKTRYQQYGASQVLLKFLDIADDLERAHPLVQSVSNEELKQGMTMILKRFHKILTEEGVTPIPALGQKCDPYKHEIIDVIASPQPDDIIVEELQKGYMHKEGVLRTSKVRVSKQQKMEEKTHV